MRELSRRSLTAAYLVALGIIAAMSLTSHLVLDRSLHDHEGAASVVNVSGRQRMLSQRIAGLAAQMILGVPTARADLLTAADEFEAAHRALVKGDPALQLPAATSDAVAAIYFGGDHPLDAAVATFLAQARRAAAMTPDDPGLREAVLPLFAAARQPLLADLNAVVRAHQNESERQLRLLQWMALGSLFVVLATLGLEAFVIFRPLVRRIALYSEELLRIATTDPLTGMLNRRSFTERAAAELARARRHDRPVSVLMVDADRFKAVNDTYGHAGGDAVLQALAATLRMELRPSDLVGRMGGEEFAVVIPECGLDGAVAAAERIRKAVGALRVTHEGASIAFTVSIGAAEVAGDAASVKPALDLADAALYEAKATGRNRVVGADSTVPAASLIARHAVA